MMDSNEHKRSDLAETHNTTKASAEAVSICSGGLRRIVKGAGNNLDLSWKLLKSVRKDYINSLKAVYSIGEVIPKGDQPKYVLTNGEFVDKGRVESPNSDILVAMDPGSAFGPANPTDIDGLAIHGPEEDSDDKEHSKKVGKVALGLGVVAAKVAVVPAVVVGFVGLLSTADSPKTAEEICSGTTTLTTNSPTTIKQISVSIDSLHVGRAREALLRYNSGFELEQKLPEGTVVTVPANCR